MKTVIFDLDGTLANIDHRLHYIKEQNPPDWTAFFEACDKDTPNSKIVDLFWSLSETFQCLIVSGRSASVKEKTEKWLDDNSIHPDILMMRAEGDYRPDHIVKAEFLDKILADGYEPWLVVDDRPSVVKMWRERGLTCLQCADWNDEPKREFGTLRIMVGPSGAGKSFHISHSFRRNKVVSTDDLREEFCGDFRDQSRNDDVFRTAHDMIYAKISNGLDCIFDATNIKNKDRLAVVELAKGNRVVYCVIDRPLEEKYASAGWRAWLDFDLIKKHHDTFQSNLKDILAGDGLPNVEVVDLRSEACKSNSVCGTASH